jgi:hypothetical protein
LSKSAAFTAGPSNAGVAVAGIAVVFVPAAVLSDTLIPDMLAAEFDSVDVSAGAKTVDFTDAFAGIKADLDGALFEVVLEGAFLAGAFESAFAAVLERVVEAVAGEDADDEGFADEDVVDARETAFADAGAGLLARRILGETDALCCTVRSFWGGYGNKANTVFRR